MSYATNEENIGYFDLVLSISKHLGDIEGVKWLIDRVEDRSFIFGYIDIMCRTSIVLFLVTLTSQKII